MQRLNNPRIACFLKHRLLATSSSINAKNPYLMPTREIILRNENLEQVIQVKTETSDITSGEKQCKIVFESRNPRHLEHLGFNKPSGFSTLRDRRNFYNNLVLKMTNRHTKAFVESVRGDILCYASTTEHYIAKQLHSTTDVCAVVNIARILADRCKKVGIERMHWFTRLDRTTEKIREFENIFRSNGIILSELPTKVLQGPSQTLPPARKKRVLPGPLKTAVKRRGTIDRVNRRKDFLSRVILD